MWSQGSNKRAAARLSLLRRVSVPAFAALLLAGCHSAPRKSERPAPVPVKATPATPAPAAAPSGATPKPGAGAGAAAPGAAAGAPGGAGAVAPAPVRPEVPPAASTDFARAVGYMRTGNATEAELGFKQIALQYPQFAAPFVNLGILYRKNGRLDESEQALKSAVEHEPASAVAWTELGVTQRMRGEFKDAAASYEQAITADPQFAPAYRNLGVVSDLYLADPGRALTAFSRYQELTHEEKPVSSWIAELRQRLGLPPVKRPEAAPPAPAAEPGSPAAPAEAPAGAPPKGTGSSLGAGV
jgi:Tfp pilus assembly protein PilF